MVSGVCGETRGPVLEAALNARGSEVGRRNLRSTVVSTSSQQWNKKQQQCSHRVKGSPNHWFAHRISPGFTGNLTVAHIRPTLKARTLSGCSEGSRANNHKTENEMKQVCPPPSSSPGPPTEGKTYCPITCPAGCTARAGTGFSITIAKTWPASYSPGSQLG